MGINISAYYITGIEEDEYNGSYRTTEAHPTWDFIRQAGDKDFIYNEEIEWECLHDDPNVEDFSYYYKRPKDLYFAINWVKKNVGEESRIITLLEEMKIRTDLYIHV